MLSQTSVANSYSIKFGRKIANINAKENLMFYITTC